VKSPLAAPVRRHHQKDHEDNTRDEADSSPLSPRVHHLEPLSRPRTAFPSTSFPTTNQPSKQSIRPLTGAGGFSRLGSKPKPQQQFDCVAKIQRLVGGLQWQVNEILDEILPEQQALMKATRLALFRPVSSQSECSSDLRLVIESHSNIILKTSELEQFKRHHRISHKAQNQPCINNIRQDTERSHLSFHEKETELKDHVLALWEHKYQANELNLKDSLYLLIHRNLMDILEHAALKRVWCRSIEETNIESKRILYNLDTLLHLQITLAEIQKVNKKKTLYQLLCQNLWQTIDQKYFHVTISTCCQIQKQQKKINIKTSKKTTTDIWIRENCLKEIFIHRHKLQNFEKQKQFASQKMLKFFYTKIHQFYKKRFFQWKKIFFFLKTCQQVKTFCQL
jgi:hypothetical protein